jgi:hypothetical protein
MACNRMAMTTLHDISAKSIITVKQLTAQYDHYDAGRPVNQDPKNIA